MLVPIHPSLAMPRSGHSSHPLQVRTHNASGLTSHHLATGDTERTGTHSHTQKSLYGAECGANGVEGHMPRAPRKCNHDGCETRGTTTYCPVHTPMNWGSSKHPGSTRASRIKRDMVLKRDPICRCPGGACCSPTGCTRASTDDDHLVPIGRGGSDDMSNHAGKCARCHKAKTTREAADARRGH